MKASSFIVGRELEICLFAVKFEISPLKLDFRRYIGFFSDSAYCLDENS
jgi:hypothetical protein